MTRNTKFHSREPLRAQPSLRLAKHRVSGPFSPLNPTRAYFRHVPKSSQTTESTEASEDEAEHGEHVGKGEQPASHIEFEWRSRDNRKGRHALVVQPTSDGSAKYIVPQVTSTWSRTAQGILRMFTQFPYWDISYLVAVIFTLGSVVWVTNAFFAYLPLAQPQTEFKNEVLTGGGITAFIGATVFEIGSVLLMFEAINEKREGCFGWALERLFSGDDGDEKIRVKPDADGCAHHHTNKKNLVGKADIHESSRIDQEGLSGALNREVEALEGSGTSGRSWQWFPSYNELTTHYLRELGFLASFAQFAGATIFWISGFTALPGINNKMSQGLLDGIYWVPQIVGGSGFIISGTLFMLETQDFWYKPAFLVLGWHIGFWNLIGAIGFTLCGALGPAYGNSGAEYQASLATFWGSWAFLIGSIIQWYESLDKYPVEARSKKSSQS